MASSIMHLSVLSFLLALFAATASAHRPPPTTAAASAPALAPPPLAGLAQRLEGEGSQQQCWEALVEVKSCTGEIVLYLLNGEAYLGPGCCRAIRVIEQSCWAADAMLSAIGFTPEEGDMLKGYCDAGDDNGGGLHGAPPPGVAARESVDAAAERKSASAHR
ncbi:unnamed protein product [Urochloa decumbens]|uniref:Prolamin-like domain-containing protein n=1 Tax=Urochloa decumbens TaxID=240449 RepID=A0ABC8XWV0_9POAL